MIYSQIFTSTFLKLIKYHINGLFESSFTGVTGGAGTAALPKNRFLARFNLLILSSLCSAL
jgi:hypothetical protein